MSSDQSASRYLPDVPALTDGVYSVIATSDGQPLGGIANLINPAFPGDGFSSYNDQAR